MGLIIDEAKEELNNAIVECVERHIKIADKYGLDRNTLLKQFAKKISIAIEVSDFSNYKCKNN